MRAKSGEICHSQPFQFPASMAMGWRTHLDAYPSFTAMLEETGDSEEDAFDRIHVDVDEDNDLNDDAMSCSYDSWDAICSNEFINSDDMGDSENGYGDSGWAYWAMTVADKESPRIVEEVEEEEEEEEEEEGGFVDGISRNAIEAMEDKEFWEACLAVGY